MKKIYFLLVLFAVSSAIAQNSDSLRINKAVALFYDSSDYVPVVTRIPYLQTQVFVYHLQYENVGSSGIAPLFASLVMTHTSFPNGGVGLGLVYVKNLKLDSLGVGEKDTLRYRECAPFVTIGEFRVDFKLYNAVGHLLDSSSFSFSLGDTTISNHTSMRNPLKTGPSFFMDTITNQSGGTVVGDRFATLFEINESSNRLNNVPSSVTFFISNDSNNIGVEFSPKIWKINEDSMGTPNFIGSVVASSFIPITIGVSSLGQYRSFPFDNGSGVFNGLANGKYAVGFESTLPNPNGKSLIIGRDTLAEKFQFGKTTYVSFGQDSSVYLVNDLPMMSLNFVYTSLTAGPGPCQIVGLEDEKKKEQGKLKVFPNPTSGIIQIETGKTIKEIRVFDINGRLVLMQEGEISTIDLEGQVKGLYLLRIQFKNGEFSSKKVLLE